MPPSRPIVMSINDATTTNDGQSEMGRSSVRDFYKDKCVLLTGASGFVGKVILEKLLRDCDGICSIYILLRSKQGSDSRRRTEDVLNSVVFSRIKRDNDKLLAKVIPVSGDITYPGLGISSADLKVLKENVSVVFHVAATIRFDEPLKRAVDINVGGTQRVLELCKQLPNLKSLVHVSTAYCNKTKKDIQEMVYEDVAPPEKIIQASQWMDDDVLEVLSTHLYDGRPSSYHYTKALAENLLVKDKSGISISIVRPSIITAAWKEPIPGWLDNYNGPTGYFVVSGKGILRTMIVNRENICDMVPVDIVANTCIVSAVDVAVSNPGRVTVFNCTSGSTNPINWGRVKEISEPLLIKHPSMEMFRYPGTRFQSIKLFHQLNVLIEHTIPASLVDFLFRITGHKPMLNQVYQKVHRTMVALEYFTMNEWTFRVNNQLALGSNLPKLEREIFCTNVSNIHWPTYLETYILGVRKFLLKEDPSTLPLARKRLERIYYFILLLKLTTIFGSIHQIWYHYETIKHVWKTIGVPVLKATKLPLTRNL